MWTIEPCLSSVDGEPRVGPLPAGELSALEANTPARGLQVTVIEPQLTVLAGHGDLDKVSLPRGNGRWRAETGGGGGAVSRH